VPNCFMIATPFTPSACMGFHGSTPWLAALMKAHTKQAPRLVIRSSRRKVPYTLWGTRIDQSLDDDVTPFTT